MEENTPEETPTYVDEELIDGDVPDTAFTVQVATQGEHSHPASSPVVDVRVVAPCSVHRGPRNSVQVMRYGCGGHLEAEEELFDGDVPHVALR